jgi:tape measure domain-containing protein
MAVRELFAKFGFEFDQAALQKMEALVDKSEQKVEALADAVNRATGLLGTAAGAQGRMGRAADATAASVGDLRQAWIGASRAVKSAAAGDEKASNAMRALGMSVDKTAASGRRASSVYAEMVGRLAKVKDEAARARLAVDLLGDAGARAALSTAAAGPQGLRTARRAEGRGAGYAAPVEAAPAPQTVTRWQRLTGAIRAGTDAARTHRKETEALRKQSSGGITGGLLQAAFWFSLARGIINAWQAIGRFAVGVSVKLGTLVTETTIWADSTQKALGMISGFGVGSGIKEFEEITRTAARLGLNVIDATENYKKLRAVGFSRDEGNELVRLAADMQAGLGLTEETTKRVYLALGQIKGAGKLQGDELRQLQETGLSVDRMWASIAEQMGVTVEEAQKLKEVGKVSADVAIRGVKEAVLGTLGTSKAGQAAEALKSTTLRGMIAGAKGGAQLWLLDLTKELEPKFRELAGKLAGTFDKFEKDGKAYKAIHGVKTLVTDFIDLVIIRWPEIEKVFGKVLDHVGDDLWATIKGIDNFLTRLIAVVDFVGTHWDSLKTAFKTASIVMVAAITAIGVASVLQAGKVAFAFGTTIVKGLAAAVSAFATSAPVIAAANTAMNTGFAKLAISAGAVGVAFAAIAAALYQVYKLYKETRADGGFLNSFKAAGGMTGFAKHLFGQDKEPENPVPQPKGATPPKPKKRIRPQLPATGMPFGGPALPFGPTAALQSTTTINVSGVASPHDVARAVDSTVSRRDRAQRDALYGALAGAPRYG